MLTMATLSGYIALTRGVATLINVPAAQITSYLVSLSFFIGQSKAVPEPIRIMPLLAMPVLAVLVTMLYWIWRVRIRRSVRGMVASAGAAS
jgi:hypothetical protein